MKCIKAIRSYGKSKPGDIKRVDDSTAFERVMEGSWIYASKMEWKNGGKLPVEDEKSDETPQEIINEVKPKKPKFKKGKQK